MDRMISPKGTFNSRVRIHHSLHDIVGKGRGRGVPACISFARSSSKARIPGGSVDVAAW